MTVLQKIKEQAWDKMPVIGRWIIYPIAAFMISMLIYALFIAA